MKLLKSPKARLSWLFLVLIASAALAFGGKTPPAPRVGSSEPISVSAAPPESVPDESLDLSVLKAREGKKDVRDVFVEIRPEPPPSPPIVRKEVPVAVVSEPVAPPQAPPLPLRYLGGMNNGVQKVFLAKGETSYTAAVSDVIENTYRLEEITEDALEFTYLPLNQRQTLNLHSEPESWPSRDRSKLLR